MKNVDNLFEEIKFSENDLRLNFELHGVTFFYNKGKGIMRKRHNAASMLQFMSDEIGMATGKYDEAIDHFMSGLVMSRKDEESKMIGSDISFEEAIYSFPEHEDGEFVQMEMMTSLPYVFALVVLGKSQVSGMLDKIADTLTSKTPEES